MERWVLRGGGCCKAAPCNAAGRGWHGVRDNDTTTAMALAAAAAAATAAVALATDG